VIESVLVGLATAVGLWMLYSAAAHEWPDSYFSVGPSVDPMVSRKLGKYALFRLGPVFLAGAFAAVTARRLHDPVCLAVGALGVAHVAHTNALAITRTVRRSGWRSRLTPILFHAVIAVAVAAALAAASATTFLSRPLIPQPSELSLALWAGLSAAVMGFWVRRLTFRPLISRRCSTAGAARSVRS
jgi:hypothetical protein